MYKDCKIVNDAMLAKNVALTLKREIDVTIQRYREKHSTYINVSVLVTDTSARVDITIADFVTKSHTFSLHNTDIHFDSTLDILYTIIDSQDITFTGVDLRLEGTFMTVSLKKFLSNGLRNVLSYSNTLSMLRGIEYVRKLTVIESDDLYYSSCFDIDDDNSVLKPPTVVVAEFLYMSPYSVMVAIEELELSNIIYKPTSTYYLSRLFDLIEIRNIDATIHFNETNFEDYDVENEDDDNGLSLINRLLSVATRARVILQSTVGDMTLRLGPRLVQVAIQVDSSLTLNIMRDTMEELSVRTRALKIVNVQPVVIDLFTLRGHVEGDLLPSNMDDLLSRMYAKYLYLDSTVPNYFTDSNYMLMCVANYYTKQLLSVKEKIPQYIVRSMCTFFVDTELSDMYHVEGNITKCRTLAESCERQIATC